MGYFGPSPDTRPCRGRGTRLSGTCVRRWDDTNHQLHMFWDVNTFGVRVNEALMYSYIDQRAMKIMKGSCRQLDSG